MLGTSNGSRRLQNASLWPTRAAVRHGEDVLVEITCLCLPKNVSQTNQNVNFGGSCQNRKMAMMMDDATHRTCSNGAEMEREDYFSRVALLMTYGGIVVGVCRSSIAQKPLMKIIKNDEKCDFHYTP